MPKTKSQAAEVAFFAAAVNCKKAANRDALDAGGKYPVDLVLSGTANGEKVRERFAGDVTVGHDAVTKRTRTPDLIQLALSLVDGLIGPRKLKQRMDEIEAHASKHGELPRCEDQDLIERMTAHVNRLTVVSDQKRRGSVSFVPAE